MVTPGPSSTARPDATARADTADSSGWFSWLLITCGLVLFPVAWTVVVAGRAFEVRALMRFLARSDAHVFFDLPGVLADLRAFPILFTAFPAAGATLIATGVSLRRGRSAGSAIGVGVVTGLAALVVAWAVVAWLIGP